MIKASRMTLPGETPEIFLVGDQANLILSTCFSRRARRADGQKEMKSSFIFLFRREHRNRSLKFKASIKTRQVSAYDKKIGHKLCRMQSAIPNRFEVLGESFCFF